MSANQYTIANIAGGDERVFSVIAGDISGAAIRWANKIGIFGPSFSGPAADIARTLYEQYLENQDEDGEYKMRSPIRENPSKRKAINARSQITKRAPGARLKRRRAKPRVKGFFPNPIINGINRTWQTFAGGTGAYNPNHNSYAMYLENSAMFSIDPPQRRGGAYRMQSFNITKPSWTDHGSFRSPQAAKTEAKRILESGEGQQRFRNPSKRKLKPVNRPSQAPNEGKASAELRARRKKTNAGPRGFFANPRKIKYAAHQRITDPGAFIAYWSSQGAEHFTTIGKPATTMTAWNSDYTKVLAEFDLDAFRNKTRPNPNYRRNPAQPLYKVLARSKPSAPFSLIGNFRNKDKAMQYARALHHASPTPIAVKVTT